MSSEHHIGASPEQSVIENAAEVLEELSNLFREGAVYMGARRDGHNDEYQYGSLLFKVPRRKALS